MLIWFWKTRFFKKKSYLIWTYYVSWTSNIQAIYKTWCLSLMIYNTDIRVHFFLKISGFSQDVFFLGTGFLENYWKKSRKSVRKFLETSTKFLKKDATFIETVRVFSVGPMLKYIDLQFYDICMTIDTAFFYLPNFIIL